MSVHVSITDDDGNFILTGSDYSVALITNTPTFVNLDPSSAPTSIFDLTAGHSGSTASRGGTLHTSLEVQVQGGVTGTDYIFGFGNDPNAALDFILGDQGITPYNGDFTMSSDGHGGTLLSTTWTTQNGGAGGHGTIDIVGDSHLVVGVDSSAHNTVLRNT